MIPLLRSRVSSRSSVLYGLRLRVQADFFLTSIALDFMYVCDAFSDGFLNPFVHLVFILIEPITTKDVATSKRWWCRAPRVFSDRWIIRALGIPPGCIENIEGVVDPLRARLVMKATQVFDGCGAKSSPTLGIFGFLLWLDQRVPYQVRSDMLGVAIPGVGKISQSCPGVFSLAHPLIGVRHGIYRWRERWRFFMSISVILCHEPQGFKFHGQPSLPKSRFRVFLCDNLDALTERSIRSLQSIFVEPEDVYVFGGTGCIGE